MYCRYVTTTTPTQAQVLDDLVKLFTGQVTDKNVLSASCDKTITELVTTTAAGWTVHDAAAGTNIQVLKAPIYDNPAQFKYLWISTAVTTSIEFRLYEGWNATTHVGTNPASTSITNTGQRVPSYSTSFTILLASSERFAYAYTIGASAGNSAGVQPATVYEYTRWSPWDTTAAGYLPVTGNVSTGGNTTLCRFKNSVGTDTIPGTGTFLTPLGANGVSKIYNASGQLVIPLVSMFVNNAANGHFGGNITEQCGIYTTATNLGSDGDELTVAGTTYIYTKNGFSAGLIPKA